MCVSQSIRIALFLALSAGLVCISWASLKHLRSHGFWRFWAWECILALFLLNVPLWFRNPFSPRQLVSWIFLFISAFLVLHAVVILRRFGRPGTGRGEEPLIAFEKTTQLVTRGLYGYIRHPMYSSLLFLAWGIFLKDTSWASVVLVGATTAFLIATARADEAECARFFGPPYLEYKKHTRMFIPWLF
jgi:protein-S-isoprenylcysteine O-methyltransferase Ste14